jgi:hypothetical protein
MIDKLLLCVEEKVLPFLISLSVSVFGQGKLRGPIEIRQANVSYL